MIPRETLQEMEALRARVEELEYELETLKVTATGEVVNLMDHYDLTASEGRILRALVLANGAPLDRCYLAELLGVETDLIRHIDSHIKRIRQKNRDKIKIDSIYGVGYRLVPDKIAPVREAMTGKRRPEKYRTHTFEREDAPQCFTNRAA